MAYLTNEERETIITFNETDAPAEVFTHNRRMKRELDKLCADRPDDVKVVRCDGDAKEYAVPKKWVKIRASRIMTEEQKEAAVEHGRKLAEKARAARAAQNQI